MDLKWSSKEIEVLDVHVTVNKGQKETNMFELPANKMYLHTKSDHPRTRKNAIHYGLGIHARRICSTEAA